ncbi:beta-defensin 132 [Tupaia chinensis]|uniref:beta-defensin 132 n=1 Tax=Tupaia chinensis TaxID=246437 RepID=UPI0003C8ED2C|nr:beta-defensin 132 [Tupaia chinensis]
MKFQLLVSAVLGFLAQLAPASWGGARCGHNIPGHCRLYCRSNEKSIFLCDRYKQCCILNNFSPVPPRSPHGVKPQSSHRKTHRKQSKSQRTTNAPTKQQPRSPPTQRNAISTVQVAPSSSKTSQAPPSRASMNDQSSASNLLTSK